MKNIQNLWIVMRQEFLLLSRGKVIWVMGGVVALLGIIEALGARSSPLGIWENVMANTFLVALLLTIVSGEHAYLDQEFHMERLIWSTPIGTLTYLAGKYLTILSIALGAVLLHLLAAILVDQFYPGIAGVTGILGAAYPGPGAQAWLIWTVWYLLAPTFFGTALAFAVTTVTHGQRIVSHVLALLLWMASFFGGLSVWLDVVGLSFFSSDIKMPGIQAANMLWASLGDHPHPTAAQRSQMIALIRLDLPPIFLPWTFAQSRLLLVGLGVLLLCLTVLLVRYRRMNVARQKG